MLQNYSSIWISRGTKSKLKHVNFPVSIDYISRMEIGRNKIALRAIYDNFLWKCLLRETTESYNTSYDRYKIRAKPPTIATLSLQSFLDSRFVWRSISSKKKKKRFSFIICQWDIIIIRVKREILILHYVKCSIKNEKLLLIKIKRLFN